MSNASRICIALPLHDYAHIKNIDTVLNVMHKYQNRKINLHITMLTVL